MAGGRHGGRGDYAIRRRRIGWSFAKQNSTGQIRHGCRICPAQGIEAEILVCPAREGHTRLERIARFFAATRKFARTGERVGGDEIARCRPGKSYSTERIYQAACRKKRAQIPKKTFIMGYWGILTKNAVIFRVKRRLFSARRYRVFRFGRFIPKM
jgi:hypothetical protein